MTINKFLYLLGNDKSKILPVLFLTERIIFS